jgi:hypothetical protein
VQDLAAIASKLKPLIRLLSSDQDGEVLNAARALNRLLKANGSDIHAIADGIGQANGKLTEPEMRKLYDAGYSAGLQAAEAKFHGDDDFRDIDGMPPWDKIARWCQHHSHRLRDTERQFVNDMAARAVWRSLTPKQEKWLRSIFLRLGGKMS